MIMYIMAFKYVIYSYVWHLCTCAHLWLKSGAGRRYIVYVHQHTSIPAHTAHTAHSTQHTAHSTQHTRQFSKYGKFKIKIKIKNKNKNKNEMLWIPYRGSTTR